MGSLSLLSDETAQPSKLQKSPFSAGFAAALLVGVSLNPLNTSIIATALVSIGEYFRVGAAQTALLVSVLYVVSAVCQPLSGKIAAYFGARTVFISGLLLAGIGGAIGWAATSLTMVVVSRLVLGLGTAVTYPTAMMMIRGVADEHGSETPQQLLSLLAACGHVMAAVGLPIGGAMVSLFGWRAVFAVNVPLALLTVGVVLVFVRAEGANFKDGASESWLRQLDPVGVLLFAGFIVSTMLALQNLARMNVLAIVGMAISALALWLWSRWFSTPLVDVQKLAENRVLLRTYLRLVLTFAILYAVLYGTAQWLEQARGLSPSTVGFLMIPMSALSAISSLVVGKSKRIRDLLLFSSLLILGLAATMWGASAFGSVGLAVGAVALAGIAMGLNNVGNQTVLYLASPAADLGVNSGFYRTFSYIGGFLATGLIGTLFKNGATDGSLTSFALIFAILGGLLTALVVFDRSINLMQKPRP